MKSSLSQIKNMKSRKKKGLHHGFHTCHFSSDFSTFQREPQKRMLLYKLFGTEEANPLLTEAAHTLHSPARLSLLSRGHNWSDTHGECTLGERETPPGMRPVQRAVTHSRSLEAQRGWPRFGEGEAFPEKIVWREQPRCNRVWCI
uniref:Uncharacterized protein n=1 Tax=Rousettus aegyptiacus TaxID=9407 RepID=A0A7J8FIL4_ROUAE|nr:hypothetical protein HJG63_011891 [Rousettus aegyptiacus]